MKKKYFPFLVGANHYSDYWTVICPENVRPLIIAKAAIRGSEFGLYTRKIVFENRQYEIVYKYAPVFKKFMTGIEEDSDIPLLDKTGGRPIHMFYGVFGEDIPKNSKLFEKAEEYVFSNLSSFLNDKDKSFSIIAKSLEDISENIPLVDDLIATKLEPLNITQDVFVSIKKEEIPSKVKKPKEQKEVPEKQENVDHAVPHGEKKIKEEIIYEPGKEGFPAEDNPTDSSSLSIKKVGGSALVAFGLGLAVYSGTISLLSAIVTGSGVALIVSDSKSQKNNEQI